MNLRSGSLSRSASGVSPVVGVVLITGIVVVLAAGVGAAFVGYGDALRSPAPTVSMTASVTESGALEIRHEAGDSLSGSDVLVKVSDAGTARSPMQWTALSGAGTSITAGTAATVSPIDGDETVRLVWQPSESRSATLQTWTVRSVPAAGSDASVTPPTPSWAELDPAFGETAWRAHGRAGNLNANGDHERAIGETLSSPGATGQGTWSNGASVPFTLSYDGTTGDATLTIDGQSTTFGVDSVGTTGDTIGLTLVTHTTGDTAYVENLRLDGQPLSTAAMTASDGNNKYILVSDADIADGFVFTGSVTFSWTGGAPSGSDMQLHFAMEEDGTGTR